MLMPVKITKKHPHSGLTLTALKGQIVRSCQLRRGEKVKEGVEAFAGIINNTARKKV